MNKRTSLLLLLLLLLWLLSQKKVSVATTASSSTNVKPPNPAQNNPVATVTLPPTTDTVPTVDTTPSGTGAPAINPVAEHGPVQGLPTGNSDGTWNVTYADGTTAITYDEAGMYPVSVTVPVITGLPIP